MEQVSRFAEVPLSEWNDDSKIKLQILNFKS